NGPGRYFLRDGESNMAQPDPQARRSAPDPQRSQNYEAYAGMQVQAGAGSSSASRPGQAAGQASQWNAANPAAVAPMVDDEWRRWIAENLLVGAPPDSLFKAMTGRGISNDEAAREITYAMQSPYVNGAALLLNRLKKREWLLATYRKLHRLHAGSNEVP